MDDLKLLGLLNPIIACIFAMMFIVFWFRQREKSYILSIGLSFAGLGIGFLVSHFLIEKLSLANLLFIGVLYTLATTAIISGLYRRAGVAGGVGTLLLIGFSGLALSTAVFLLSDNLNLRLYFTNATFGLLWAIGAWRLRKLVNGCGLDTFIMSVMIVISLQFIGMTAVTLNLSGVLTPENYSSSLHWRVINFSTGISSLVFALTLIAMCAIDLLNQVSLIANQDLMTGLNTRRAFESNAEQMMRKLDRTPLPVSLLILDIDHFKSVNDKYGHPVGDEVITQLGRLLSLRMRSADIAGRLGGEEFAVLLWNTDEVGARLLAEEVRSTFSTLPIDGIPDDKEITVSIGVAELLQLESYDSLYSRADKALYAAKNKGRNRVALAPRAPDKRRATEAETMVATSR
jgi:diguanylate cyclase (GGDEF)-like protein